MSQLLEYPPYPHFHAYCPECHQIAEWLSASTGNSTSFYCQNCGHYESYRWSEYPEVSNEQGIFNVFHKNYRRGEYATQS